MLWTFRNICIIWEFIHDVYPSIFMNITHLFGKVHNMDKVKNTVSLSLSSNPTKKDLILVTSYRHITLLSTVIKVIDLLVLNLITPFFPLLLTQDDFRPQHLTSTLLTPDARHAGRLQPKLQKTTHCNGHKQSLRCHPHKLIDKIYNTNMHNNSKRWLANYLSGRKANYNFNGTPSKNRPFTDVVPQGSLLSPTMFNFFSTISHHPPLKTPKSYPMQMTSQSYPPMINATQLPQTLNITETHYKRG